MSDASFDDVSSVYPAKKRKRDSNEWVNTETGEIGGGFISIKGSRYPRGVEFTTMFLSGLSELANRRLKASEYRLILLLLSHMSYGNYCRISQVEIAKELGISSPAASVAIGRLKDLKLVGREPDPEEPGREVLRISTVLTWRGRAREFIADQNRTALPEHRSDGSDAARADQLDRIGSLRAKAGLIIDGPDAAEANQDALLG